MRVGQMQLATGQSLFVCRRYRMPPGNLTALGVPPTFARKLNDAALTEGLVVFMGKAGSGKTTTAASFISERLTMHGGVCWTVENPIDICRAPAGALQISKSDDPQHAACQPQHHLHRRAA